MKMIVGIQGQGYEASPESIEIFTNLAIALSHYKKEYLEIDVRTTTNPNADLQRIRRYEALMIQKKQLVFERDGGFWLRIFEKEIK